MYPPSSVDESAPVVARHTITIDAPIRRVWELQTDINRWTDWQHDITAANSPSPLAVGESFTWTSFGFTVTSTIYGLDTGTRILWGGEADGIMGIHEWTFHSAPSGTIVTTQESFSGQPVDQASEELRTQLDYSLTSWLNHLKTTAERD